jgi:hypothetical protein
MVHVEQDHNHIIDPELLDEFAEQCKQSELVPLTCPVCEKGTDCNLDDIGKHVLAFSLLSLRQDVTTPPPEEPQHSQKNQLVSSDSDLYAEEYASRVPSDFKSPQIHQGNSSSRVQETEHDRSSIIAHRTGSQRGRVMLYHDSYPSRRVDRPERRYSSDIGIGLRGFPRPEFAVRRLDDRISRTPRSGPLLERENSQELIPEAPIPPPTRFYHSHRESPLSSMPTIVVPIPNRPTPPLHPGAVAASSTGDTAPSLRDTQSVTSSSSSKVAYPAVDDLPHMIISDSSSSETSNKSRSSTYDLTRLRFRPDRRSRDVIYGLEYTPLTAKSREYTFGEARSKLTSGLDHIDDNVATQREDYRRKKEDWRLSKSCHIIRHVRNNANIPKAIDSKIQEDRLSPFLSPSSDREETRPTAGLSDVRKVPGEGKQTQVKRRSGSVQDFDITNIPHRERNIDSSASAVTGYHTSDGVTTGAVTAPSPSSLPGPRADAVGPVPVTVRCDRHGRVWMTFDDVPRSGNKTAHRIRCDIHSVFIEELSSRFKIVNCAFPHAYSSKEGHEGRQPGNENELNAIGWALASLNPALRGNRVLLQRAAYCWRDGIQ